jgi:hypothetical protein
MEVGTKFKLKNTRGTYSFLRLVENKTLGVTWVDCFEDETKQFRSFYPDKIKGVIKTVKRRPKVARIGAS